LVVSVSGTRSSESEPVVYGLENFSVTRGGTSSRIEIINGKVNAGIDYTYFIQPQKTGKFRIGPAEITTKGQTFRSNAASINIIKPAKSTGVDRGPLFLSAGLSSSEVYVEEQAIYTLKLYRRTKVGDLSLDLPETQNLTFKQLGKPLEYQSEYGGQTYQVLEVRYALVSSKEGSYTIGASRMNMTVFQPRRRSRRRLFDDPFFNDPFFSFSSGRPMTLASEPLELKVLPLPNEGRPADFTGLVGKFEIESKLEPPKINAGESATLTVWLRGRGNVNRLPDLKGPELDHTKLYADQPALKVEPDAQGLAGSKTMKWALVPENEGLYEIPPMTVSFFDTTTGKYRVISTSPHSLSVLPGKMSRVQNSENFIKEGGREGPVKQPIKELARDILPVHTSMKDFMAAFPSRPKGLFFLLLLCMPAFAYTFALFGTKFRRKSLNSSTETKARKASKLFIKKCHKGNLSASELTLLIRDYLNDRFALTLGSLTPDDASKILKSKGVGPDTAMKLRAILEILEDAIYTGKGSEACDVGEDLPRLIKEIEREIR
jgi:hypothetical protein